MRLFRVLLVLLLCMALPMTGLAATGLAGPCPMQMSTLEEHEIAQLEGMPDCDTMESSPNSGLTDSPICKSSVHCQLGSLYHPVPHADVARPAERLISVAFSYVHPLIVSDPNGLWRPPRTL